MGAGSPIFTTPFTGTDLTLCRRPGKVEMLIAIGQTNLTVLNSAEPPPFVPVTRLVSARSTSQAHSARRGTAFA
jgi:hypothetical protein